MPKHLIQTLSYCQADFSERLDDILNRTAPDVAGDEWAVDQTVAKIIAEVRLREDDAVVEFTQKFDNVDVACAAELELTAAQKQQSQDKVSAKLRNALEMAAKRIRFFHAKQKQESWEYIEPDGTRLGQKITAMQRAGIYVPGGKAAYPSSVLMTAIPARVAGVKEIIMVVPTPNGEIDPAVLAAADIAGVDRIFTIGGAQAVAALAYGTITIPKVDIIVGPGNRYVASAKKQVFGDVGIDMIAGPSEVLVVCDSAVNPDWVAMDLFAQAEHDECAQAIFMTDSATMIDQVKASIATLLPQMSRKNIIEKSLQDNGAAILVESKEQMVAVCNLIAPEHLEFMVKPETQKFLEQNVTNAGAIFVGRYSAEVLGDYCAGANHVLPTSGTARFSSPLGVADFQKRTNILHASKQGAAAMAEIAAMIAEAEGLTAHQQSALLRLSE